MKKNLLQKLLIIDDDEDILAVTALCLQDISGINIRCVTSGEEGIKTALDFQPDLILLDFMMPKMGGAETLKVIKNTPLIANIPVIFFTAKVLTSEMVEYFKLGIVEIIVKPYDPLTLASNIMNIWKVITQNRIQA